jgi:hypothetical protein
MEYINVLIGVGRKSDEKQHTILDKIFTLTLHHIPYTLYH